MIGCYLLLGSQTQSALKRKLLIKAVLLVPMFNWTGLDTDKQISHLWASQTVYSNLQSLSVFFNSLETAWATALINQTLFSVFTRRHADTDLKGGMN